VSCWFGVSAHGVAMYQKENRLEPLTTFKWSEIRNISFTNRKFKVKTIEDSATVTFWTHDIYVSQVVCSTTSVHCCLFKMRMLKILDLCLGSHNLYLRRRQPDTLEIQQMRMQAKAEKALRQVLHSYSY
jgi:hypothetical protein